MLRRFGLEIVRIDAASSDTMQLSAAFRHFKINTVFDVGANRGQFGAAIRSGGYQGKIISFEPLSTARKGLLDRAKEDPRWVVHPQAALGDSEGSVTINISGNSVSSSILPMLESHYSAATGSLYTGEEIVPLITLDSVAEDYLDSESRLLIKIDAQGFEWQVLDGAVRTLQRAQGVLCELSLTPLYEGQKLWLDIIRRLEIEGFSPWVLQKGFTDSRTGRGLQVDGVFFRE